MLIVIADDAVVMADLIRHPRRPREGTVVIVQGYGIVYVYASPRHPRAEQVDVRDLRTL
jgi:hypothetical protein